MNNTPTPKTDEAWSCFSGYTEPLRDVKDLSHELERKLIAMTEQRDGLRAGIDYASNQLTKVKEQRDRLAEALRDIVKSVDPYEMYKTAKRALKGLEAR